MYAREVEGRTLTFGVSGKLIMNALVMYDRQTDSLWSQFLGVAVQGPLAGTELEVLPSVLTDWGSWRALHPDTTALDQGGPRSDSYASYYTSDRAGVIGESSEDGRLARKDFVLGLRLSAGQKAYAFVDLERERVLNDRVGDRAVLIAFNGEAGAAVAYDPVVGGESLTFERYENYGGPGLGLLDRETGTVWSGLTGEALAGELAGQRLETIPSFTVFWFAWSDYFPDTALYEPVSGS